MGHYNASSKDPVAGATELSNVYHSFQKHCSADRVNTDLAITIAIRECHPGTHVTTISGNDCDLIGYAAAGHMKTSLKTTDVNYLARRTYSPPRTRLEEGKGKLGDHVSFGLYDAEHDGHAFNFYEARWRDEFFGRSTLFYYILSPNDSVDAAGHTLWVDEFLLSASKWSSELHDEVYVYDGGDWGKNKQLWKAIQNSTWDDVIMDPTMKETLISDVQNFFDSRSIYEEYAVPWKRGIILHGTPGCGKTISIKSLMNALDKRDQPVASLIVKSFTSSCPGEEYSIREIFQMARVMAPCMLVFEDLDSLIKDKIRSYFLNEVDGLDENNGILMIGSTNHLDRLDPGIAKRPSRFDRKYHFKVPGYDERILYCEYWKKKLAKNSKIEFDPAISDVVAKMTEGFSFAYMKELFVQTLLTIVGGRDEVEISEVADEAKIVEGSSSVVGAEQTVESDGKEDATTLAEKEKNISKRGKRVLAMPQVEIPENLKDNALMRVMAKQVKALWMDMDNSEESEEDSKDGDKDGEHSEGDGDGGMEAYLDFNRKVKFRAIARRVRNG